MSKVVSYENYRVVIEPRRLGALGGISVGDSMMPSGEADRQRQYRELCHDIAQDVKRHVDNVGFVSVEFDTVGTCAHCGANWTEDSPDYNGGCCAADEDAQVAREAQPQASA